MILPARGFDIVVLGGANTDFLVRGGRLPAPGETVVGGEFHEGPGGKGANQAVAAARLGARVAFVGRVGDDARGRSLLDTLTREGVDTTHVASDAEAASGAALVLVAESGEKQILVAPGANARVSERDVEAALAVIRTARVVLLQLEVPLEAVVAAARAGKESGARTVLDPAPAVPLDESVLGLFDVVRPNAGEARMLTGITVTGRESARAAAHHLLLHGVGMAVAVQAGSEGNLLVTKTEEIWLPHIPVRSVDATGAGDAFAAALAVAIAEQLPWAEAGWLANAAAALATTVVGAQAGLPLRAEATALVEKARSQGAVT
jgi:ribokinase